MQKLKEDIALYLRGDMPEEQIPEFLKRFYSEEGRQELYREIEELWEHSPDAASTQWDAEVLFSKIQKSKENQRFLTPEVLSASVPARKPFSIPLAGKIAASFLLATLLTLWGLWVSGVVQLPQQSAALVKEIEKCNPPGQKSTLYLPDGSKVILNSDSRVTYFSDFGQQNRTLRLYGEAYFEVKKDTTPFVVVTGELSTRALGTSFNINTYDGNTEVSLITGKVAVERVSGQGQKMMLVPGEAATLHEHSGELEKTVFDIRTRALWKDGVIHFDHTSLQDAVKVLERWYGVEILMENTPPEQLYCTGVFKNDYLSNVLESIGFSLGFSYEIDQKKVKLIF